MPAMTAPQMNFVAVPKIIGDYTLQKTIGRGNFAQVSLAKNVITDSKVAIKIVDKTQIDAENLRKTYREIEIMKQLRHPHIIRLYQVIESERLICMVTEYASGGEIYTYLKRNKRMQEKDARKIFRQMTAAVAYCHSRGLVHRDLKAENILLDSSDSIKLADFGFSNYYQTGQLLKTCCGSPPYAAPELFQGLEYDGFKTDVWSLGVLLYVLVTGGFPFPGNSYENLRIAVLNCRVNIPYFVSVECSDLIRKMLVLDPLRRFSVQQVTQHKWFTCDADDEHYTLIQSSLSGSATFPFAENEPVNDSVVWHLQQRGFCSDLLLESVLQRKLDSMDAAYNLLCDRLRKLSQNGSATKQQQIVSGQIAATPADKLQAVAGAFDVSLSPVPLQNDYILTPLQQICSEPRRGSITTGTVSSDVCLNGPRDQLSVAEVLALNRPSPPYSSEDSMNAEEIVGNVSDEDAQAQELDHSQKELSRYLAQRRHTLGVPSPAPVLQPTVYSAGLGGNALHGPGIAEAPYPIRQTGAMANELLNLAKQPNFAPNILLNVYNHHPWAQMHNQLQQPQPFGHGVPFPDNPTTMLHPTFFQSVFEHPGGHVVLPNFERRASDGACLFSSVGLNTDQSMQGLIEQQQNPVSSFGNNFVPEPNLSPGSGDTTRDDVSAEDEDVKRYLRTRGNLKRHTVHATQPSDLTTSPTRDVQRPPPLLGHSSGSARHYSSQPYPPTGRRCSDIGGNSHSGGSAATSGLPASVLAHLERLHAQALLRADSMSGSTGTTVGSGNVWQLQQEFNQLRQSSELNQQLQGLNIQSPSLSHMSMAQPNSNSLDRACISARSSPPAAPGLHMITEESAARLDISGMKPVFAPADAAAAPTSSYSVVVANVAQQPTPAINITDERGGTTMLASRQTLANNLNFMVNNFAGGHTPCPSPNTAAFLGSALPQTSVIQQSVPAAQTAQMDLVLNDPFSYSCQSYQEAAQRILNPSTVRRGSLDTTEKNTIDSIMQQISPHYGIDSGGIPFASADHLAHHQQNSPPVPDQVIPVSRTVSMLVLDLKRVLQELNIACVELPDEGAATGQGGWTTTTTSPFNDPSYRNNPPQQFSQDGSGNWADYSRPSLLTYRRRRLSVEVTNGMKVEIGLAPDCSSANGGSFNPCTFLDFRLICGNPNQYRELLQSVLTNIMTI